MKASHFFIHTLKEAPTDAETISHKLMMRAGMIRPIASGIYSYMPLGLRVMRNIEAIVREEMDKTGALELLMPCLQPAELWRESGRAATYGAQLMRLTDRNQRDFLIGPTHEEVITDIVRKEISSYRQIPVSFYQIQTKFRDELRPRFGTLRAREFIMKDAYSFDRDSQGLAHTYRHMIEAYKNILARLGLRFRIVAADNGAIGGSQSHEFHVIADTGEDRIAYCPSSDYAANLEAAEALPCQAERAAPTQALASVHTPGQKKCEAVAAFLGIPLTRTVKSIVLMARNEGPPAYSDAENAPQNHASHPASLYTAQKTTVWLILLRGDHTLNEVKAAKVLGTAFRFATAEEILEYFGVTPGTLGPIGSKKPIKIVADRTVAHMSDFVCGANRADYHLIGVNWGRDLPEPLVADLRNVQAGERAADGSGALAICRGIEVGHVFALGTRYSEAMAATYLDEAGQSQPLSMGCYGIGITRILAAAIEQNADPRGMIWPQAIAPFEAVLCPIGYHLNEEVRLATERLYTDLISRGIDLILDDRKKRIGAMFADWELIGIPHRLVISGRSLRDNKVEYQGRRDTSPILLDMADLASKAFFSERASGPNPKSV